MKTNVVLGICLILGFLKSHTASARVLCDASASTCQFVDMPLYSQNDSGIGTKWLPNGPGNSMMCGPTSAAMAIQALVNELSVETNLVKGKWTEKTFITPTKNLVFKDRQNQQIRDMASLMGASPTNGVTTAQFGTGVFGRKADFKSAGGKTTGYPVAYTNSEYISYVKDTKSAVVLMYGHYNRTSSTSNGKTYYKYARNGGHIIALNGYSDSKLLFYDPWYANRTEREITQLTSGCSGNVCQNLPTLSKRSVLFTSGSKVKFVDAHTRLWAE